MSALLCNVLVTSMCTLAMSKSRIIKNYFLTYNGFDVVSNTLIQLSRTSKMFASVDTVQEQFIYGDNISDKTGNTSKNCEKSSRSFLIT